MHIIVTLTIYKQNHQEPALWHIFHRVSVRTCWANDTSLDTGCGYIKPPRSCWQNHDNCSSEDDKRRIYVCRSVRISLYTPCPADCIPLADSRARSCSGQRPLGWSRSGKSRRWPPIRSTLRQRGSSRDWVRGKNDWEHGPIYDRVYRGDRSYRSNKAFLLQWNRKEYTKSLTTCVISFYIFFLLQIIDAFILKESVQLCESIIRQVIDLS